ncbi:MAG: ankyrin repeat domain-containing protein [Alphaproteobacteria bacterium]|nr:ankyrin repeat domain-containing protein [Alphaproteobacteria bacterium]OJV12158.1 MAG: hypothetical protein BGO27_05410 [Alphaproteobacteria bacterium 33-17]
MKLTDYIIGKNYKALEEELITFKTSSDIKRKLWFYKDAMEKCLKVGDLKALKLIIEHGGNPLTEDKNGDNLLHNAAMYKKHSLAKNRELISYLKTQGINIDNNNVFKNTPLYIAVAQSNLSFTRALLEEGADVDCQDKKKKTPLHIAAENGDYKTITYLLAYDADVNIQDKKKNVPMPANKDKPEDSDKIIGLFLIAKGADINLVSCNDPIFDFIKTTPNPEQAAIKFLATHYPKELKTYNQEVVISNFPDIQNFQNLVKLQKNEAGIYNWKDSLRKNSRFGTIDMDSFNLICEQLLPDSILLTGNENIDKQIKRDLIDCVSRKQNKEAGTKPGL